MIKKRVTVYLTDDMYQELKRQSNELGLSMSAYLVHLLMLFKK